jgi:hypothetical protein
LPLDGLFSLGASRKAADVLPTDFVISMLQASNTSIATAGTTRVGEKKGKKAPTIKLIVGVIRIMHKRKLNNIIE